MSLLIMQIVMLLFYITYLDGIKHRTTGVENHSEGNSVDLVSTTRTGYCIDGLPTRYFTISLMV